MVVTLATSVIDQARAAHAEVQASKQVTPDQLKQLRNVRQQALVQLMLDLGIPITEYDLVWNGRDHPFAQLGSTTHGVPVYVTRLTRGDNSGPMIRIGSGALHRTTRSGFLADLGRLLDQHEREQ